MRIVLFGLPGAGKGTQANLLSSYLKVPHLSTGEILRSKLNDKDELSMKLKNTMSSGNLVSDNILNSIVSDKLLSDECKNGFILDGYPRTFLQAQHLNNFLKKNNIYLDKIININIEEKTIEKRIISRSQIESRDDDSLKVIRTRINTYFNETEIVTKNYKEKNPLVFFEINGEQDIEKIQLDIRYIAI